MEADAEIFKRRFDDSEDSHQRHFFDARSGEGRREGRRREGGRKEEAPTKEDGEDCVVSVITSLGSQNTQQTHSRSTNGDADHFLRRN